MRRGQRGQSLVETALALPVLLLLCFGVLQLGLLAWQRLMLQHAAHCAARAYTVWQPQDEALASRKAERAAWLALRGAPRPLSLRLQVQARHWRRDPLSQALSHELSLQAEWRPLLRLPFWSEGLRQSAHCSILSEDPHDDPDYDPLR